MKYIFTLLGIVLVAQATYGQAVVTIGSGADLTIKANEQVYFDGMVLTPSVDFTLQQNTITKNSAITSPANNPASAIQRAYTFSAATNAFTGSIRLYYLEGELGAINESNLVVNAYNGSMWTNIGTSSRDLTGDYIESQVASFGPLRELALTSANSVLPLHWGTINATKSDDDVIIRFTCYDIAAVDRLQVQRSIDGQSWNTVAAINQPSPGTQSFEVTDKEAPDQKLYYRIVSSDLDGKQSFSAIVSVAAEQLARQMMLSPNPASDIFTLKGLDRTSVKNVSLLNASGLTVKSWQGYQPSYAIGSLASGIYIVKVLLTNGEQVIRKLVK